MSEPGRFDRDDADYDHLSDVEPGTGCTGIWEHLSEQREPTDGEDAASD